MHHVNGLINIIFMGISLGVLASQSSVDFLISLLYAFNIEKMMRDSIMVRKLDSCENLGEISDVILRKNLSTLF